MSKQVHFQHS